MVSAAASLKRQRGVTYFWVLLLLFLIALGLGKLLDAGRLSGQRAREADLLFTGNLYRNAIHQYVLSTPAGGQPYPEKIEDLLHDPRYPVVRRYLRRTYPDPMTGEPFVPVPAPEGGVMGVRSASQKKPLKTAGFQESQASFAHARTYRDWEFSDPP
jgi:hypothetical protein